MESDIKLKCITYGLNYDNFINIDMSDLLDKLIKLIESKKEGKNCDCIFPKFITDFLQNDFDNNIKKLIEIIEIISDTREKDKKNTKSIEELNSIVINIDKIAKYIMTIYKKNPNFEKTPIFEMLSEKYKDIPYSAIKILVDKPDEIEDNLSIIKDMITLAKNVKNGRITSDKAENKITEELNSKYIYSHFGSKENFEKSVKENAEKIQQKK